MRTPAGKECRHYYEDFNRGRDLQECRLVNANPQSLPWRPEDCARCPVPDILNANANPYLELMLTIKSRVLGFGRQIDVTARCERHDVPVEDPFTDCEQCSSDRRGLDVFRRALEQDEDNSDD
jgi:hypothetical protein